MKKISLIFCGSFQEYSPLVLKGLLAADNLTVLAVVTTPPHVDSKKNSVKNPVQLLAETFNLPVFTPEVLDTLALSELENLAGKPEILITAGYGKLLPESWLSWPTMAALNLHFSLLPKWRGANPAEWALLCGDKKTGVTLIEMSPSFDTGTLVASAAIPIASNDTRQTLYEKLYTLGGQILPEMIQHYAEFKHTGLTPQHTEMSLQYWLPPMVQSASPTPYAARFKREDGRLAWRAIAAVMAGKTAELSDFSMKLQQGLAYSHAPSGAEFIARAVRALQGFPDLWTVIPTAKGDKRMKLLRATIKHGKLELEQVQIEGKPPTRWAESKNIVVS